ncbi:hypothetical protein, partial [Pseudomonas sp. FW306-2-2C-D06B]
DQLTAMNDFIRSTAKKSKSPQELFKVLQANNIGIRINNDNAANLAFSFIDGNDNSLKASQVNLSMKSLKAKFKDFNDEQLKDIVRQAAEFTPNKITHDLAWIGKKIDFEPIIKTKKDTIQWRLKKYQAEEHSNIVRYYSISKKGYEYDKFTHDKKSNSVSIHEVSPSTIRDALIVLTNNSPCETIKTESANKNFCIEGIKQSVELGLFDKTGFQFLMPNIKDFSAEDVKQLNDYLRDKGKSEIEIKEADGVLLAIAKVEKPVIEAAHEAVEAPETGSPTKVTLEALRPLEMADTEPQAADVDIDTSTYDDLIDNIIDSYEDGYYISVIIDSIIEALDGDIEGEPNDIHALILDKIQNNDVSAELKEIAMKRLEGALIADIEFNVNLLSKMHLPGNSSHSIDEHRAFDKKYIPSLLGEEQKSQYGTRQRIYELKDRLEEINPDVADDMNHAIKERFRYGPGHLYKYGK